jgi:hypothetical protein
MNKITSILKIIFSRQKFIFTGVVTICAVVVLVFFPKSILYIHPARATAVLSQTGGTTQGGASSISASLSSSQAGNVIIVCIQTAANLSTSVTDNQSNSYTLATRATRSGSEVSIYYAYNTTGGVTNVTGTFAGWSTVSRMIVAEYSGLSVSNPLDRVASYDNGWNGGASFTSSSTAATTQSDELLIGCAGDIYGSAATFTSGSNYTGQRTQGSLFFEDRIVSTTSAYTATGSHSLSSGYEFLVSLATFKINTTPSDSTAPEVGLSLPAFGATLNGDNVAVSATSTDDTGVVGVRFYYDSTNEIGSEITATSAPNTYTTSWNTASLIDGSHTLIAVSRDAAGNRATSSTLSVYTQNPPIISAVASSTTATTSNISWTTNESSTSQVEYGSSSTYNASSTLDSATTTSHTVLLSGLATSTLYHFRILSADSNNNLATSTDYTFTTTSGPDVSAPTAPGSFTATSTSSSQINLSWNASSDNIGVSGYNIYRNNSFLASTTQLSYSDTGLTASTAYSYYSNAFDAANNLSSSSTPAVATTSAASTATGTPVIFFTDITSGPKTGGENNNGVFVTIYGNYFGSNPTVTVGGGAVAQVKSAPSTWMWYQKMTIQLGSSAQTGNIVVTTENGTSNGLPFTVRNGNIYFVSTTGSNSNVGSFASPWLTLLYARDHISPGDTVYAMDGVSQTTNDGQGWNTSFLVREGGSAVAGPMALIGYPGATVTLGNVSATPAYGIRSHTSNLGYWVFANLTLTGLSGLVTSGPTAPASPSSNWRIVGNVITCPNGDGESGCLATQNSNYVYLYGNNVNDTGVVNASSHYHAVYISTDTNHVWIGYNTVAEVRGCRGIQVHSSALGSGGPSDPTGHNLYDLHIFNNLVHDTQCDGIILATVDPSQGTVEVYNNVIYNAGQGPANPENTGAWTCVNVDDMTSGGLPGSGTVEVYNNTLYNCGSWANPPYGNANAAVENGGNNSNLYIRLRNNLIYQLSAPYLVIYTSNSLINGSYNLFYGQGAAPNQTYVTNSVVSDPVFAGAGSNNFHLLSTTSPAYNSGLTIGALTLDFEGNSRPQTDLYDIGAYEFASGSSVVDTTAPSVTAFVIPATSSSLTVGITTFTATDATGVTGYKLTETSSAPAFDAAGWSTTTPASYVFSSEGSKTLYAWAKDAAGNVSSSLNDSVTITLPEYTLGGSISGLNGTVILQNNSADDLSISSGGDFVFGTVLSSGENYLITVLTNPSGQTCSVTNASGTVASANIANISVICANTSSQSSSGGSGGGGGGGVSTYLNILEVKTVQTTASSVAISWLTNLAADSKVEYGTTSLYGMSVSDTIATLSHRILLTGLMVNNSYHFRIMSKTSVYTSAVSSDYVFTTASNDYSKVNNSEQNNLNKFFLHLINQNGTYYVVKNGQRLGVTNPGMLFSYGLEFKDASIPTAAEAVLPEGPILSPGDGALVKSPNNPTVYLISIGKKHGFNSEATFRTLGFSFTKVLVVTAPELDKMPIGEVIADPSLPHKPGTDINIQGTIYYIDSNNKRLGYPSETVWNSWHFDNDFSNVVIANQADLSLPIGEIAPLRKIE